MRGVALTMRRVIGSGVDIEARCSPRLGAHADWSLESSLPPASPEWPAVAKSSDELAACSQSIGGLSLLQALCNAQASHAATQTWANGNRRRADIACRCGNFGGAQGLEHAGPGAFSASVDETIRGRER
jgi:hypothetical protein